MCAARALQVTEHNAGYGRVGSVYPELSQTTLASRWEVSATANPSSGKGRIRDNPPDQGHQRGTADCPTHTRSTVTNAHRPDPGCRQNPLRSLGGLGKGNVEESNWIVESLESDRSPVRERDWLADRKLPNGA